MCVCGVCVLACVCSGCLPVCLHVCLFVCLSVSLSVYLSVPYADTCCWRLGILYEVQREPAILWLPCFVTHQNVSPLGQRPSTCDSWLKPAVGSALYLCIETNKLVTLKGGSFPATWRLGFHVSQECTYAAWSRWNQHQEFRIIVDLS